MESQAKRRLEPNAELSGDGGQKPPDAQRADAAGNLHSLLAFYGRLLWDVQKVRIQTVNRVKAIERDGLGAEWAALPRESLVGLIQHERDIGRQLERLAKQHVMADWVAACPGLGYGGFARIVAVTGSFEHFATVSKVWKYMGLHTEDGLAPKKHKGEKLHWSPQGRVVAHQIGDSIVKLARGKYRELYDRKKAEYEAERPDWPQIRRHRAAIRYAVKQLIKDMWVAWRATSNL